MTFLEWCLQDDTDEMEMDIYINGSLKVKAGKAVKPAYVEYLKPLKVIKVSKGQRNGKIIWVVRLFDASLRYKYAIYFTWNDGEQDSFNVYDAEERDANIKEMIERKDFKSIEWCRIYASGEYGINHKVL